LVCLGASSPGAHALASTRGRRQYPYLSRNAGTMSEPDTRQPGGEREIERLLFEIVQADSPDQLIGHTIGGLSELSTAALLYYERDTDGAYRLVHARDRAGTRQRGRAIGELGAILADHLPELVEGDGSPI